MITGLSAAQAQSQGFIEVVSDADTASVANRESLFVGESDDESTSSQSRSESSQKGGDGKIPRLNPAAAPFDPKPTTSANAAHPNPFSAATTFGKPSGTQMQSSVPQVFDLNSNPTNQAVHHPFESKHPPKFNFLPANTTKAGDSTGTPSVSGSKEPPKSSFFPPQSASKAEENSNGSMPSPFALSMEKKTTFGKPSIAFPATISPESTKTVAGKLPASTEAAAPPNSSSIFNHPAASSAPSPFSFGISPLFGSGGTEAKLHDSNAKALSHLEEKPPNTPIPQQTDAANELATSTTPLTPQTTPSSPFTTSNSLTTPSFPPAAPFKFLVSSDTPVPTPEPQFNLRSSQTPSIFPPCTTPSFQPTISSPSSKSSETIQKPTSSLKPTVNSRALSDSRLIKPFGSQPGQEQSTSAPSQLDPKLVALDKLSRILLLEDNGIIQHFIEFTVGPIIKASISQFDDDSSWKEASQSSPSGSRCGERVLIGNRGMSCDFVGQKVL